MKREKFIHGDISPRTPAAEVGQIWRWKNSPGQPFMLLNSAYESGFHCLHSNGGTMNFNTLHDFYEKYEYIKDATSEEIETFKRRHDEFNGIYLAG